MCTSEAGLGGPNHPSAYHGLVPDRNHATRRRVSTRLVLAGALATIGVSLSATAASADTREVGCANLQTTINEAATGAEHGAGDVIVLDGLCTAGNLGSATGVTLPAGNCRAVEIAS